MDNKKLSEKILNKVQMKIAISKFEKEEHSMQEYKKKLIKMVAVFTVAIGLTASMVYAGSVIYENIFKKPEKIENYIEELKVDEEDLSKIITIKEAEQKVKQEIKRYGFDIENLEPQKTETIKSPNSNDIEYHICFEQNGELTTIVDAFTGKFEGFYFNPDIEVEELEKCTSTRDIMIKEAENKMKEYGFDDEYEVSYISSNDGNDETKSYYWYISFSKKYDGIFNPRQTISMTIIPEINVVRALYIREEPFENNPIVISEEEAVNIARDKDKIVNTEGYTVKDVKAKLAIKPMTPDVYLKENNLTNGNESIQLEDGSYMYYNIYKDYGITRKVYVVEITYGNRPINSSRKYYIDTTTGEVIGGEDIFDYKIS